MNINLPSESRKRTADRLSEEMEEENSDLTGRASSSKRTKRNLLLQQESQEQDSDLDEDEQALARSLPPISTTESRPPAGPLTRRSNIMLSSDDGNQPEDYQGEC
jgi:hypothetical protein